MVLGRPSWLMSMPDTLVSVVMPTSVTLSTAMAASTALPATT